MGSLPTGRTFVAGETETAAYMNSVSAAINFLLNPPRCSLWQNSSQVLGAGTPASVTFDQELYDTDSMHNPGVNPSRITPQTPGLYHFIGQIDFGVAAATFRQIALLGNGSSQAFDTSTATSGATVLQVCKDIYCNGSTDYVEIQANSATGVTLPPGAAFQFFQARWVANS